MVEPLRQAAALIESSPTLRAQMADDPVGTLQNLSTPLQTDVWIYRAITIIMGLVALSVTGGYIALAVFSKAMPDGLSVLGGTAVGALAGVLTMAKR